MLAAVAPTVKFPASRSPEQAALDQSLSVFWALVERLHAAADQHQPIHQVEEAIFRDLLVMGRSLLQAFLASSGDGDLGPTLTSSPTIRPTHPVSCLASTESGHVLTCRSSVRSPSRGSATVRAESRPPPWMRDCTCHGDSIRTCFQQWLGAFVVDDAHAEAIKKLGTILGLEVSVKASEDLNREQGGDVEPFQNHLPTPEATEEGPILVVTADCKGVPLVRSALPPERRRAGAPLPKSANKRRGKGEKANKKKMAAVGAVYTIDPFVRTADEVIDEVMRKKAAERRPEPAHKRVRAELLVGKVALFLWLADEVIRRDPTRARPLIFLSDGERALHDRQGEYLPEDAICILDLFHVMERLWKAAWCFFDESTPEEGGPRVGGEGAADAPGREGALCGRRLASDDDQAGVEGDTSQDGARGDGVFPAEPGG